MTSSWRRKRTSCIGHEPIQGFGVDPDFVDVLILGLRTGDSHERYPRHQPETDPARRRRCLLGPGKSARFCAVRIELTDDLAHKAIGKPAVQITD